MGQAASMRAPPDPIRLADAPALERLGARVALRLRRGEAACLWGPLGAGKTTFARGLVRALTRPDEEVPSPTFTLVQHYDGPDFPVAHFDLYRLRGPEETWEVGLDEALEAGAAVIEWSERLESLLPPDRLDVRLSIARGGGRLAALEAHGLWAGRASDLLRP